MLPSSADHTGDNILPPPEVNYQAQVQQLQALLAEMSQAVVPNGQRPAAQKLATELGLTLGGLGFTDATQLAWMIAQRLTETLTFTPQTLKELNHWGSKLKELTRPVPAAPPDQPEILLIDEDLDLAQALGRDAPHWEMQLVTVTTWADGLAYLADYRPSLVVINPHLAPDSQANSQLLSRLSQASPAIPTILFTDEDSWRARLAAIRLGSRVSLAKPVSGDQVWQAINDLLHRQENTQAHVLIVDDDPVAITVLKRVLAPWGLDITAVQDPQKFWQALEATIPDLVILDVQMPGINGIELCQMVRSDPRWGRLPIVFFTASTEPDLVTRLFAAGADDFVSKPIIGPELVTRILNRLERTRLLRSLAETDPLTGIFNRRKAQEMLEKFIGLAQAQIQPMSLVMLDLDHFKQVNDRYGHSSGDQVLVATARLLRQSLRPEDVVARWGGEEFLIGMYGLGQAVAVDRMRFVLEKLRKRQFTSDQGESFQVSFSAGVAEFPEHGLDLMSLYRTADETLYAAKANGRNQILAAQSSS